MKVVVTTWEGGGNVTPILIVVRKLVTAGHDVRVVSDACNRRESEAAGARFLGWSSAPSRADKSPDSDILRDWEAPPGPESLRVLVERIMCGPAEAYGADLLAELAREKADLVVASGMLLGVIAACESIGQRVAAFEANVSLAPLPGVPPIGPGLMPPRNDDERAQHAEIAAASAALFNDAGLDALNRARHAFGLAPLTDVFDQLEAADAVLLGTSPSFDFAPDTLPPNTRYVGPQLGAPAWAESWNTPWARDDRRPLVLVAFSTTFQDHVGVLQRIVDALGHHDVRVVVTLGPALARDAVRPAANTHIVASAPHGTLMSEAALVVTHGGHGTVINALAHGAPLMVLPHGRDQNDNAVRVTARGAGVRVDPPYARDAIDRALGTLLSDPGYRTNARALGARIARDAASSTVVADLEALAAPERAVAC